MDQDSTPYPTATRANNRSRRKLAAMHPRQSTLDFIRQFARAYYADPAIPYAGMALN